jgi:hypothetical protein
VVDKKFLTLGEKTPQEIKTLTIQNLARVLTMTAPTTRRIFADYYICLQDHVIKWRIRASICGQLPELMDLFEPADTLSFIVPMFFLLCKDEVAEVRKMAASHFHLLLQRIQTSIPEHVPTVSGNMCLISEEKKFNIRMVFVDLFASLVLEAPGLIDQRMREALQRLATDATVNVRIKVALFVHSFFQRGLKNDFCDDLLALLAKDGVRDIQTLVQKAVAARNKGKGLVKPA